MEDNIFALFSIGVIPAFTGVALYYNFKSKRAQKLSYWQKQIIAGIVFGCTAIVATEKGVPIGGAVINTRDASPIIAGLVFGGPAGVIAGVIGAVERWVSVYWSGAYYTRVACSISTLAAGIYAGWIRKVFYNEGIPATLQSLLLTSIMEIFHMLMIFITNMDDVRRAFYYVETCTVPMLLINSLSVAMCVMLIRLISNKNAFFSNDKLPGISRQIRRGLLAVVLAGYAFSILFSYSLQNSISNEQTRALLELSVVDATEDVLAETRRYLYIESRNLARQIGPESTQEQLAKLAEQHDLAEINLVGADGIIFVSNDERYIGFDMKASELPAEFTTLLNGSSRYVQDLRDDCSNGKACKFAGIATDYGFLQIGMDLDQYHKLIADGIRSVTDNRHVGESGIIMVIDENGHLISNVYEDDTDYSVLFQDVKLDEAVQLKIHRGVVNDVVCYYMVNETEGYRVVALYPQSEADFSRRLSVYLTGFIETMIFGLVFAVIFVAVKHNVISKIVSVNESLKQITAGDLDTVVNVGGNKEFVSLSEDINLTVGKLKTLIAEANERIDSELRYARQIQNAALPSHFPAFPERDEFDIYALMDPAKEVGGDFYDFYLLNDHVLAFLVADVSGKGIPASLFMMRAKTALANLAQGGVSVGDIFINANYQLCHGNDADMFVTAWMGMLDLRTGELVYANAGHNRPLLKRKDGTYEYLQGPAGFVLAGMEGIVYKSQSLVLEPGDEIFLYTDGVVEATDVNKQLYGDDRLKECINRNLDKDAKGICEAVLADVNEFYSGAEQFDDITELSLRFLKKAE